MHIYTITYLWCNHICLYYCRFIIQWTTFLKLSSSWKCFAFFTWDFSRGISSTAFYLKRVPCGASTITMLMNCVWIVAACACWQISVTHCAYTNTERLHGWSALSRGCLDNTSLVPKLLAKDRCSIIVVPNPISAYTNEFSFPEDLWDVLKEPNISVF